MDINKIFQSKIFQGVILGIAGLAVVLFIFKAGMFVGERKANFSCRWSDNYHRNFGGPRGGFAPGFGDRDFLDANGTFGKIIKIDGQQIIVGGANNAEKVILVDEKTVIRSLRETIKISDLKVDDTVVVVGEPNNVGQIEAKLIRVMPNPGSAPFPSGESLPPMPVR